jgi:hypothetical protein
MTKRASNFIDLSGEKFNMLTAIKPIKVKNGIKWLCECDCGKETLVSPPKLKSGHTKSCGCFQSTSARNRQLVHGFSKTKLSNVRNTMVQRCHNPRVGMFYTYGARGIKVCDEWRNNPKSFYEWAMANGYKEGLSIDRINNDGNYEPSNCQWITIQENLSKEAKLDSNKRKCLISLYTDSSMKVKDIAKAYSIDTSRIYQILKEENIKTRRKK